jgi:hypothetical protein
MAKITELLLVPHTHHDIGYTHVPDVCMRMHEQAIYEAMGLCEAALADDSPAAFRWTVEISRPLIAFLRGAASADVARLQALVARGRMAVTAGYLHMTQLIGHEEYVRFFLPLREIRERYGLPVSIVQHGDINGLSWGGVPLMREAGLDCLVMALNPDHGRAPFEQPSVFWWAGPDGSRVLVCLNPHYSTTNNPWELTAGRIEAAIAPLAALVARTQARADYPFDFLVMHAAEDNMLPNGKLGDAVRAWNAAGLHPRLRIVTQAEAVDRIRAHPATPDLPVVRGEWADWWAHGHASSAYELGVARLARAEVRTAEAGQALHRLAGATHAVLAAPGVLPIVNWYRAGNYIPALDNWQARVDGVYDNLLLFEEHTWGTFETVSHPFSLFNRAHWNRKAAFAYDAVSTAHDLAREALAGLATALPPGPEPALMVLNPLGVPRADLVPVRIPGEDREVWVSDLPPLGVKVVPWDAAASAGPLEESVLPADSPAVIENDYYRLEIDPGAAAITRLYDKALAREWVDPAARGGIGAVVYETTDPADPHPAVQVHRRHFHPNTPGPAFVRTVAGRRGAVTVRRYPYGTTLTVESTAPYLPRIVTTITLFDTMPAIDVTVALDKHENYAMEGVYVLFPFACSGCTYWLETANAVYRADEDQLPVSCRDWYSIQHGAGITDGRASVLWATREAPIVQLGGFHTGEWATRLDPKNGHLYAWLMNNLYFTNFQGAQAGHSAYQFRFTTRPGGLDGGEVRRWGEAFAVRPLARLAPIAPGTYQWLDVQPETVAVQLLKPALDAPGAAVLRLKETAGAPAEATIRWLGPGAVALSRTDFLETAPPQPLPGDGHVFRLPLAAHALATVQIVPQGL